MICLWKPSHVEKLVKQAGTAFPLNIMLVQNLLTLRDLGVDQSRCGLVGQFPMANSHVCVTAG